MAAPLVGAPFGFGEAQGVLNQYCQKCHHAKAPLGGLDVGKYTTADSVAKDARLWGKVLARVRDGEMPPPGAPALDADLRGRFVEWVDETLRASACAEGLRPGPVLVRRLNRNEYAATMRDLLNIHINAGAGLPADGAGGEGFDNAAETLFLSPIHAEKYLEAAKMALNYAFQEPRARGKFVIAEPGEKLSAEEAARKVLAAFLPRAFRRPVRDEEVSRYVKLFAAAQQRGDSYDDSLQYALQAVLISPNFLFRFPTPGHAEQASLIGNYELATRLSYYLWGSMPDDELLTLAGQGKLHDVAVLRRQVERMLKDARTREFAEHFVEQWLNTRELGRDIKPDAKLFPAYYDAEIQSAIRYEPILFFQELMTENLSLLNLLDSKFTILTNKLQQHYGITLTEKLRQQPKRVDLPEGTHRGGLLGMAAVMAVSSYSHRTSPVLRGKWVLEAVLGTPPPPPPPNVPELKEHEGSTPTTLRERLMQHRQNPACASCHNRIDPLGFGLENFDVLGRWRTEDNGKPIDAQGELPDGTRFNGVHELRQVLLSRKDVFIRNLTTKMLAYALGRGLTLEDQCTVDHIAGRLKQTNYSAHTLITEVVLSVPFRYQPAGKPAAKLSSKLN
ncbi:MAG: DUF1592 domain-containing protein [Bryobacterales bacterium]|nr:DUF1592 domain-containing protein [Bryobacterales bacterium]